MKSILMMMCLALPLCAQTLKVVDESPADSPVSVRGTITFGPSNQNNTTCALTGHNSSSRMIIAYTMELHAITPDGWPIQAGPWSHDHFFNNDPELNMMLPQPRLDFPLELECEELNQHSQMQAPLSKPPFAAIKVTFVQFDDGTIWGKEKAIQERMFQRREALAYLQALKTSSDLARDLANDVPFRGPDGKVRTMRLAKQYGLRDLHDTKAAAAKIDKDLATAEARKDWLK